MRYSVLRSFGYSHDGIVVHQAVAGSVVHDLPHDAVPGLRKEGYIAEVQATSVPERKVIERAPQDKQQVVRGPRGLWFAVEDGQRVGRGYATESEARGAVL